MKELLSPNEIVHSGLCIGCGSCVAQAQTNKVSAQMRFDAHGELKPEGSSAWFDVRDEGFTKTCPFSPLARNEDYLAAKLSQRYTLNITRADMIRAGYSPSVRLFEAAACGVPIISDYWNGLESVFELGKEILISASGEETLAYLKDIDDVERQAIGERARQKILKKHTAAHRAQELIDYLYEVKGTLMNR